MWRATAREVLPDYCAARKLQPDPDRNFIIETTIFEFVLR